MSGIQAVWDSGLGRKGTCVCARERMPPARKQQVDGNETMAVLAPVFRARVGDATVLVGASQRAARIARRFVRVFHPVFLGLAAHLGPAVLAPRLIHAGPV